MQAAIERCKSTVTDILKSAGEARGDAPIVTTVNAFLADIAKEWQDATPSANLHYDEHVRRRRAHRRGLDAQAARLQPAGQRVRSLAGLDPIDSAHIEGDTLWLEVRDLGPGFAEDILEHLGTPYQSTKGRGGGLGLFLVVNVVRKLGGSVSARNHPEGGAVVTLRLPLEASRLDARAPWPMTRPTSPPPARGRGRRRELFPHAEALVRAARLSGHHGRRITMSSSSC